ncbi:MAG: FecR domain-containing protein [Pseudomonadota bacterium]
MPDKEPKDPKQRRRSEEAANIFRRLEENPNDIEAQKDRDAFLARGETERAIYRNLSLSLEALSHAYKAKRKPKNTQKVIVFFVLALGSILYFLFEPASIFLIADERTGNQPKVVTLISGDNVHLDGSSAITEDIDDTVRRVQLLRGAAFFDVNTDTRPFVVTVGDLNVRVTGTRFEITKFTDQIVVSVADGTVEVGIDGTLFSLTAGERLRWDGEAAPAIDTIPTANIGSWRNDILVTEGMTFGEVVQIIDRRLPGPVFIIGEDLSAETFRGRLNVATPLVSLEALATTAGARVRSLSPIGTVVSKQ